MNERDYSAEALTDAEDKDSLEPWGFGQFGYTVVEDSYDPVVVQKVESVLDSCDAHSVSAVCALLTALEGGEKSTELLTYELGFGTRIPLLQPYTQMALDAGLLERTDFADKAHEYWKLA